MLEYACAIVVMETLEGDIVNVVNNVSFGNNICMVGIFVWLWLGVSCWWWPCVLCDICFVCMSFGMVCCV